MLRGKRVVLCQLQAEDRERLFEWINDAEAVRLNAPYRPIQPAAHQDWFEALAHNSSTVAFAIRALPRKELIGIVQLLNIHPVHRTAEMRIRIGSKKDLGQGLGTETLMLLLAFAWKDLNLHRVTAEVFADNMRAIASYKKAGFVEEGKMREAAFVHGVRKDIVIMRALNRSTQSR